MAVTHEIDPGRLIDLTAEVVDSTARTASPGSWSSDPDGHHDASTDSSSAHPRSRATRRTTGRCTPTATNCST